MKKETKQQRAQAERDLRANPINVFSCGHKDCEKLQAMNGEQFKIHLHEAHSIGKEQMKGKRQMMAHIDGDYWFSYNYEWSLDSGLTFYQYVRMARDKKSMMYH